MSGDPVTTIAARAVRTAALIRNAARVELAMARADELRAHERARQALARVGDAVRELEAAENRLKAVARG